MNVKNISIVAHVDHGKTKLTERILEIFGFTAEVDDLSVEKNRGITVRSQYFCIQNNSHGVINIVDTPGHIEFQSQVVKFLNCIDLVVFVVDCVEGMKPQSVIYLQIIRKLSIPYILVVNKIDKLSNQQPISASISELDDYVASFHISAKNNINISPLVDFIKEYQPANKRINAPEILAMSLKPAEGLKLIIYTGHLQLKSKKQYYCGKTAVKLRNINRIEAKRVEIQQSLTGDIVEATISSKHLREAFATNITEQPNPQKTINDSHIVKISVFPVDEERYEDLCDALLIISILDALVIEKVFYPLFGPGIDVCIPGPMYTSILKDRLFEEFDIVAVVYTSKIKYLIDGSHRYYTDGLQIKSSVKEPFLLIKFICKSSILKDLLLKHRAQMVDIQNDYILCHMPISGLSTAFMDEVYTLTSGIVIVEYNISDISYYDMQYDILTFTVHTTKIDSLSDISPREESLERVNKIVDILHPACQRQPFPYSIRGMVNNRCVKSINIRNYAKDVTAHLYGGDVTRKQKLLRKQSKGRSKQKESTTISISRKDLIKSIKKYNN